MVQPTDSFKNVGILVVEEPECITKTVPVLLAVKPRSVNEGCNGGAIKAEVDAPECLSKANLATTQ